MSKLFSVFILVLMMHFGLHAEVVPNIKICTNMWREIKMNYMISLKKK